jgi:ubiquinone/menaquinone biosynthesis C-methylase UbiE
LKRGYQYDFSTHSVGMHDVISRERKAKTMVTVLSTHTPVPLNTLRLLNVGGSAGIIDNFLADYFQEVVSIDIDEQAIEIASNTFRKDNLKFQVGDALNMQFADNSFDIAVCSQVYEHVADPHKMIDEIFRVIVPGGVCYFAASNRFVWHEPHYHLPLLSVVPRPLAHLYVRLMGRADHYHELHYTYWQLKKLVRRFILHDITSKMIHDPLKYHIDYMVPPDSTKAAISKLIADKFLWLCPGYIWLLQKPSH